MKTMIMVFLFMQFSVSAIASQVHIVTAELEIEPNSTVSLDKAVYGPSQQVYVSISDPNFNLDRGVVENIDLTQIVSGHPIVEVVIRQPSEGTITLSAVDGSLKDRNGNVITKAVESGPNTAVFEFEIQLPDNIEPDSSVTVLYQDPYSLKTGPETSGSSVNNVMARLDTDKNEVSLGNDLTIILAEPDANIDSRSIDNIPLSAILITSDKFNETPLDKVIDVTGIRTSYSSLRETEFNSGVFKVTLENINSKLTDRNSHIRITFFDDTSPGTGPIRIEKAVSVVPGKISIAPPSSTEPKSGIISVSAPRILTPDNTDIVKIGDNTTIMASITNAKLSEQSFVFIVQVIDPRGFTSELSFVVGKIMPEQSMSINHMWTPDVSGVHTVRVFVWDNLTQPHVLTPSKNLVIAVN
jgi:hypothetical protein